MYRCLVELRCKDSMFCSPASGLPVCRFDEHGQPGIALPLYVSAAGIVAAIVGTLFVRTHEKATQHDLLKVHTRAVIVETPSVLYAQLMSTSHHLLPHNAWGAAGAAPWDGDS